MKDENMIYPKKLPKHLAIIMDGNGRWACTRGQKRVFGHKKGVEVIREIVRESANIGIRYLTLYSFSEENWKRPEDEVGFLMNLLKIYLIKERKELNKNNIRLRTIGNTTKLPKMVQNELEKTALVTKNNNKMDLILALSYSGREDILKAIKNILKENVSVDKLDADYFRRYLETSDIPDPDLLIRTSGERRISNFLIWETAYSEIYITDTMWPDFNREELFQALMDYERRERRFGGI